MITGAGSGIGYACARAFSEQGAELILSDIDGPTLKRAVSSFGGHGRFCDVASESSVEIFTAEVLKIHSSLDVLINAAGKSYVRNLGTLRITRAFLPMMKSEGKKKDIVNIAPMSEVVPKACHFPYAASQEAFERLSQALAENVRGTKIALTTIVPSAQPNRPKHDPSSSAAVANLYGLNPRNFESFDPDRVAAAVVAAVQSRATRPGKTNVLTAQVSSHDLGSSAASLTDPRVRKLG